MKTKRLLQLLVIAGIVLIILAFPYAKLERTLARADAMWWEDCAGMPSYVQSSVPTGQLIRLKFYLD